MNSTQLHYREATRHLDAAKSFVSINEPSADRLERRTLELAEAQVHATLGLIAALQELSQQADPQPEAVAEAVGVLRPIGGIRHHAHNAFGSDR